MCEDSLKGLVSEQQLTFRTFLASPGAAGPVEPDILAARESDTDRLESRHTKQFRSVHHFADLHEFVPTFGHLACCCKQLHAECYYRLGCLPKSRSVTVNCVLERAVKHLRSNFMSCLSRGARAASARSTSAEAVASSTKFPIIKFATGIAAWAWAWPCHSAGWTARTVIVFVHRARSTQICCFDFASTAHSKDLQCRTLLCHATA